MINKKTIALCVIFILSLCSCSTKSNITQHSNSNVSTASENKKTTSNSTHNSNTSNNKKSLENISNVDISNLNKTEKDWFYEPKKDGIPSGEPKDILNLINKYSAYYLGNASSKIIYLTFDEGYEDGYTSKILDILKQNNIKAAFFVTTPYINGHKDLIIRMLKEGHLVCNHSTTHLSMPVFAIKDKNKFDNEFLSTEKAYEKVTGKKMAKFFRPPMGKYSELSLYYTEKLGYKTIFWSFAYEDWDPKKQPSKEYAKKIIMERTHNGGIFLLHAVSKTNTEILDSILKEWKNKGYQFKSLEELK